ncbi:MAG: uroporphyrinogen decarboxylase family protein [bacterium]
MGMFETTRPAENQAERNPIAWDKLRRMRMALSHQEPDRVPISDFFWGGFTKRWREELGLAADASPYDYYDLDWIVTVPNMDPWIRSFETLRETPQEVTVKTGFGAIMRKVYDFPMPEFMAFETDTLEKLEEAVKTFDRPDDPRRFFSGGDNQIAGVGDGFERNTPAWAETVGSLWPDFPVFGSIIEVNECMTRLIGPENHMMWVGLEPERMAEVIARVGQFYLECAQAEIDAAAGKLDGFVIWGDFAYKCGTFMNPDFWREHYKPWVKAISDYAHAQGLMVIYHGCGNVNTVIRDFAEMGIDAYNPLEAKAGMNAVQLRREMGHTLGFCGNSDIQIWETGDWEAIRREVLRKLNAAKGGGFIFQSDHSVASNVSGKTYDYIVKLVRQYGRYPLNLGEYDENV